MKLQDFYDAFAHDFAKETGSQLDGGDEAMFWVGAKAALSMVNSDAVERAKKLGELSNEAVQNARGKQR